MEFITRLISIEHRGKLIMRRRYNNTPSDTVFILKTLTKRWFVDIRHERP